MRCLKKWVGIFGFLFALAYFCGAAYAQTDSFRTVAVYDMQQGKIVGNLSLPCVNGKIYIDRNGKRIDLGLDGELRSAISDGKYPFSSTNTDSPPGSMHTVFLCSATRTVPVTTKQSAAATEPILINLIFFRVRKYANVSSTCCSDTDPIALYKSLPFICLSPFHAAPAGVFPAGGKAGLLHT